MSSSASAVPAPPAWLARLATAPSLGLVARAWWWTAVPASIAGYLSVLAAGHLWGTVGAAALAIAMLLMALVARNASAEAARPGSVRRGSLLRGAGFGLLALGAMLSLGWTSGGALLAAFVWVLLGAGAVALRRPTTRVALGLTEVPPPVHVPSRQASTPEIVAALRASATEVRHTRDPWRMAELAEQRGGLLDELQARDPQLLRALLDELVPPALPGDDGERASH
jgi:hypothetical protein